MKLNVIFLTATGFFFLFLGGTHVDADCNVVTIYQGSAKIVITSAQPFKEEYWKVDFDVIQSLDSLITQKYPGKPIESQLLEKPFFKGSPKDVPIKCDNGVCEILNKVDFKTKNVHAMVSLIVDCPDANYIDYIKVIKSEIPLLVELPSIPLMEIKDK